MWALQKLRKLMSVNFGQKRSLQGLLSSSPAEPAEDEVGRVVSPVCFLTSTNILNNYILII